MLGQLPYFSPYHSDWNIYIERLEQYFEVNDVDAEKKKALLLTSLDESVYKTLRDVCHPQLPKDKTYAELIQLLSKQFVVRTSIYRERVAFYTAKQEVIDSIAVWFARLKKLSVGCQFGEHHDDVLLDRFISGIRLSAVLDRLCEEDHTLTLAKAVEIATAKESSGGPAPYEFDEEEGFTQIAQCSKGSAGATKKRNRRKKGQKQQADVIDWANLVGLDVI